MGVEGLINPSDISVNTPVIFVRIAKMVHNLHMLKFLYISCCSHEVLLSLTKYNNHASPILESKQTVGDKKNSRKRRSWSRSRHRFFLDPQYVATHLLLLCFSAHFHLASKAFRVSSVQRLAWFARHSMVVANYVASPLQAFTDTPLTLMYQSSVVFCQLFAVVFSGGPLNDWFHCVGCLPISFAC